MQANPTRTRLAYDNDDDDNDDDAPLRFCSMCNTAEQTARTQKTPWVCSVCTFENDAIPEATSSAIEEGESAVATVDATPLTEVELDALFGNGVSMSSTLSEARLLASLELLCKNLFFEASLGFASSHRYLLTSIIARRLAKPKADEGERENPAVQPLLRRVLTECIQGEPLNLFISKNARFLNPAARKDLLFVLWVLRSCEGRALPSSVKLYIFFMSCPRSLNYLRGVRAVLCATYVHGVPASNSAEGAISSLSKEMSSELAVEESKDIMVLSPEERAEVSAHPMRIVMASGAGSWVCNGSGILLSDSLAWFHLFCGPRSDFVVQKTASTVMDCMVRWMNFHGPLEEDNNGDGDDVIGFDLDVMKVDQATLFEVILLANEYRVGKLLDLACKTVANMIKGKGPDEIRKTFNIRNDFTPEEEEQVRRENEWCEER